jgi:PTH2 family peptidyl-tRNA hydrolase
MYKQVIVVRTDLKMSPGKLSTQVAHASLSSVSKSKKPAAEAWGLEGSKKVVLKTKDLAELQALHKKAKSAGLPCSLVMDAGRTHLEPGTTTCLAIGPAKEADIDKITKHLKLL